MIEFGGETLVLTHDTLIEGVHTLEGQDPADIAWKLVAVNLSDLAAKGADPVGVLISHMLGDDDHRFIAGLRDVCSEYAVPLLGGDTVRGEGARSWACTAIGKATCVPVPSRSGAQAGDTIYLGGPIGRAMIGLEALRENTDADDTAYRRPAPQLALGRQLAPRVTAMMDVSDGVMLDASRIALASGMTLSLSAKDLLPLAPQGRFEEALRWGDDYVLLATGPTGLDDELPVMPIGEVLPDTGAPVLLDGATPTGDLGFMH